jgi:serine/threonine protein kinase
MGKGPAMIAKLTPAQVFEFERVLDACEASATDDERRERIEAVADATVRGLLGLTLEEPLSARNLRPGMRLGNYELVDRLGGGGFGEVWSAKSAGTESARVAIKVVRSEHLRDDGASKFLRLFTEEIEHHRQLAHSDIVKLLDAGSVVLPGNAIPTPYLVMELWNGLPLPDACRGHSVEEKIRCLLRICEAVQFAHRQGLMHLDLKPENILVLDDAGNLRPKLLDFGIARRFRPDRPFDRVRFGAGTMAYKAPEQIEPSLGGEDFRTDVHALGVLLFQVLTDRLPYPVADGTANEYRQAILHGPRQRLIAFDISADGKLQVICDRAMAIDRSQRYDSPARLAEALRRWLRARVSQWKRWTMAGGLLIAGVLGPMLLLPVRQSASSVQWKVFPIHWAGQHDLASLDWRDICWRGQDGWLCGALNEQEAPGLNVGQGIVLHTSDGGKNWTELPRTNFTYDRGKSPCFEEKTWDGVGPLNFIDVVVKRIGDQSPVTNGWAAGLTGVYFSTNAAGDNAQWTRVTPPPDGPDCFSFFYGLAGDLIDYQDVYAFGWQGIAHWEEGGQWTVELKSHQFTIGSVVMVDRENREVWATGGGRLKGSQWGDIDERGALFHYTWPGTNWERVYLPGIALDPGQGLKQIKRTQRFDELFIIGNGGLIIRGTLSGTNWVWKKVQSHTRQSLNAMAYDPDLNLWIVGSDGTILKSSVGETWKEIPCFDEKGVRIRSFFNQIRFFDRQGWVVGNNTVLRCDLP